MRPKLVRPRRAMSSRIRFLTSARPSRSSMAGIPPSTTQRGRRLRSGLVAVSYGYASQSTGNPRRRAAAISSSMRAGAAPVVDTGELEVGDLHVNAGRLRDGDGFADGLAAAVGLVANVRRVRGAVAAEHARQRQDLGAVGMAAGSGEESGGEPPGAGGQGLREQALHLGQL